MRGGEGVLMGQNGDRSCLRAAPEKKVRWRDGAVEDGRGHEEKDEEEEEWGVGGWRGGSRVSPDSWL